MFNFSFFTIIHTITCTVFSLILSLFYLISTCIGWSGGWTAWNKSYGVKRNTENVSVWLTVQLISPEELVYSETGNLKMTSGEKGKNRFKNMNYISVGVHLFLNAFLVTWRQRDMTWTHVLRTATIENLNIYTYSVTYGGSHILGNLEPAEGALGGSHQSHSVSVMHLTALVQLI